MCKMAATSRTCSFDKCLLVVAFGCLLPSSAFKYFSTKTPYNWIHTTDDTDLEDKWYNEKIGNLMCSAVHTSLVIRHGTRYPGQEDVRKINEIHNKIKNEGLEAFPALQKWENPFPDNDRKPLASLGEIELEGFGKRTAQRLFSLFAEEDTDSFRYIISSKERSRDSAVSFHDGFTNILQENVEEEEDEDFDPETIDRLLRFHTLCEKYVKSVEENKTAFKEYYDFEAGTLVTAIKNKLSKKLGFSEETLTGGDMRTIYLMCGYEAAIFGSSPWCQLFEEDDMKILEYLGDLKHYYKNGAGHDITWKQACPLVSDIFYNMDDAIEVLEIVDGGEDEDGYIIGQFAFGHAETLGPLYTALGLFNDSEPLHAGNFHKVDGRKFRSSLILPFAANLQLILYECEPHDQFLNPEDDEAEHKPEYYIRLLVNEKSEIFPGCEAELCPYKMVREMLKEQIDSCNFGNTCKVYTRDEL